ncbi:MAG: sigma-70 family RNA polymerase sigma factor [Clostridia bacterium]|nr:sigma-70 family RNA polymerase sigma factor [Clostridia bacterium]
MKNEVAQTAQSAFDAIYNRNCILLDKAALRYMEGDAHNAEELLQETWLFLAPRVESLHFPSEQAERAYLLAVLKNKARDMRKALRVRARRTTPIEELEAVLSDPSESMEERVEETDVLSRIAAVIRTMNDRDRALLTLILYSECTIHQAAEALGCSDSAANSQYHRAKKRLAQKLRKVGILYDEN